MIVTIATKPSRYFFSGDLILSPNQSVVRDVSELTEPQLKDIIEAQLADNLTISNLPAVTQKYEEVLALPSIPVPPTGPQGVPGKPGLEGASAYIEALAEGFIGTRKEWLDSLKGVDAEMLQPNNIQSFKNAYYRALLPD